MSHMTTKFNLMAMPKSHWMNVQIQQPDGTTVQKVCVVIEKNDIFMQYAYDEKKQLQVNVPLRLWQLSTEDREKMASHPSHRVNFNLTETNHRIVMDAMTRKVTVMSDEEYTTWLIDTFQNPNGTAKMPTTREEAVRWAVSRMLRIGLAWEDQPKTEGNAVATAATMPAATPTAQPAAMPAMQPTMQPAAPTAAPTAAGDDLPF